jgi:hypothetical protein
VNIKGIGNIVGLFVGLAIVAVIAAKPAFLDVTFKGFTGLINASTAPVRGK